MLHDSFEKWDGYWVSQLTWLLLLVPLTLVAIAIPKKPGRDFDFHYSASANEFSWRTTRCDSIRLDPNTGRQTQSATPYARGQLNQRGERVVLSHRPNEHQIVQFYAATEERLLREQPLDPVFANATLQLIDGRYVLAESTAHLSAIDLDDIDPKPFSLIIAPTSNGLGVSTIPFIRENTTAGNKTIQLFAIDAHAIVLLKEWRMSTTYPDAFSQSGDSVFSVNTNNKLVERRSVIDGELIASFSLPAVPRGFKTPVPHWYCMGQIVMMYSTGLDRSYAYDFVSRKKLFSPNDSPVVALNRWPKGDHVYFQHIQFRERNLLTIYNAKTGQIQRETKINAPPDSGFELSDGRLALLSRREGITISVLDPNSGIIQSFTPMRWVSYAIPFLVTGIVLCVFVLVVRSGHNGRMDLTSVVCLIAMALVLLVSRLSNYSDLRMPLHIDEFQVYFAFCVGMEIASASWLFFSITHWLWRLMPFVFANFAIGAATAFYTGLETQAAIFVALVLGLLFVAMTIIAGRFFGFRIVSETEMSVKRTQVRLAYGLKDMLSLTVVVAAFCVGGKAIWKLEEYGWIDWNLCECAVFLGFFGLFTSATCLSRRNWVFCVGCSLGFLVVFYCVLLECVTFYNGSGPMHLVTGWLYPNELKWNLNNEADERSLAGLMSQSIRLLFGTTASVFLIAIVLRNHGWRLRRLRRASYSFDVPAGVN